MRSLIGRAMGAPGQIGWQDIYRNGHSCVILGEAGSGKSREMEEQAEFESGLGSNPAHAKASRAGSLHSLQR